MQTISKSKQIKSFNSLIKREKQIYQEYIKNRVLTSEKRLIENGSDNLTRDQIEKSIKKDLEIFLNK